MRMLLKTVTRTQGNNRALKDGEVKPRACELEFVEVDPLIDAFRRMVRGLEFDLSEMALTTFITARAHGKRMAGLPIFLMRAFHHGAIVYNTKSGIASPKDLEGRRVGVNRGYTVTTGLWARSILARQYGVDLSRSRGCSRATSTSPNTARRPTWYRSRRAARWPTWSSRRAPGGDRRRGRPPRREALIAKPKEAAFTALRETGHYPINHLMVIKEDLLEARPELAADLFEAFAAAKRLYVERLKAGRIEAPTTIDETYARVMQITGRDPCPTASGPTAPRWRK
jgi:4,5-dihydroxyphthalate decarboxylase